MTSYNAAPDTIEHITSLVYAARPQWDSGQVYVVLHAHALQVDGTDLAIAALRAAKNENYLTPKAIGWRGPHWDGLATMPAAIVSAERCGVCGRFEPQCYTTRKGVGDDHAFEPARR